MLSDLSHESKSDLQVQMMKIFAMITLTLMLQANEGVREALHK